MTVTTDPTDTQALDPNRDSQLSRTTRNLTAVAISTILANGLQFVWITILARLIGAETFGLWSKITAFVGIAAALPEFSSNLIVLRDVAQRPKEAGNYLSATLVMQPLLGLVASVGLILVSLLLPNDTETRVLLAIASLSLIIDSLGTMGHNQLLAIEQMTIMSVITVVHRVVLIALALSVVIGGGGLVGVYVVTIGAGLFRAGLYWWALRRHGISPRWPVSREMINYMFRASWPIGLSISLQVVYRYINSLIVATVLGNTENGYFGAAFTIVFGIIELSSSTVLVALSPLMSRLATNQRDQLRALVDNFAFLTVALALPLGIGISLLAGKLSTLLFPGFLGTAAILEIMIWQGVVAMLGDIYSQALVVQDKQNVVFRIRMAGITSNLLLNALLLPYFESARGAALASLGAQAVMVGWMLYDYRPDAAAIQRFGGRLIRVLVAGACMSAAILLLQNANLFVAGIIGVAIYGVAILILRAFAPEHWQLAANVAKSVPVFGAFLGRVIARLA
jgi:O-antigen/teichoic acid export membrane protein